MERMVFLEQETVLKENEVKSVSDCGGQIIVSPNLNTLVIKKTKDLNMLSFPGVFTPTECFDALQSGADGLKFFPASLIERGKF
jgi:2-dehydro-3-deoxyphosphogalactonate aldolase